MRRTARMCAAALAVLAVQMVVACGSGTAAGSPSPSPSPSATPAPTPVPPAGAELTAAGDIQLVTTVAASAVTCSFPSLDGLEIMMFVQNADQSLGGFITLSPTQVFVRIGAGSGTSYTQRNFAGKGVTGFDAAKGARFNATLADTSDPGQNKGTIGAITSVAGSVSCGTKKPGGGSITITGDSTGGPISGALTSMLVACTPSKGFALVNGLTHVGSAAATVEIGGGAGGTPYFASISTASGSFFFNSSMTGLYTLANDHVQWNNAVLTQTGVAGASGHTVTVSGDATCGS